ncbi:MAG: MogA/MoaB family molybdenum cofactor biosynthesis protein [Bacteroidales bacterium]|nr:MogA/MoaB family molybdenum cofactor biosynthesis protein [Bacteroidales bacterium]MBK7626397.1 MogA/MoaB family molybdenum cofactor biosynthesis protein [Bacteroidales bacterium]
MSIPEKFKILVITLSDRASRGEYDDLSGPRVREIISEFFSSLKWEYSVDLTLIPDDASILSELLKNASDKYNIVITTGGTGIGPRDITVETVTPLLDKEIPGIMEFIRIKYGTKKPNALLSRGVAGVMGKALVYTLPGSVRAVEEYMTEILKTMKHTVYMQYGIDSHEKH